MKTSRLFEFLRLLGPPLGIKKNDGFLNLGLKIMKMTIIVDNKGFINFHNLLHSLMKTHVLDEIYKKKGEKCNERAKKELRKKEKKFFKMLQHKNEKTYRQIFTFHKKYEQENVKVKYHPINSLFYCYLAFNLWRKFPENLKKIKKISISNAMKNEEVLKNEPKSPKSQFFKESQNPRVFKLTNNFELQLCEQKKKSIQSVILEQEEENEERKPNEKVKEGKRMTMNKVFPIISKKKVSC